MVDKTQRAAAKRGRFDCDGKLHTARSVDVRSVLLRECRLEWFIDRASRYRRGQDVPLIAHTRLLSIFIIWVARNLFLESRSITEIVPVSRGFCPAL
jgi:hypothetical protein